MEFPFTKQQDLPKTNLIPLNVESCMRDFSLHFAFSQLFQFRNKSDVSASRKGANHENLTKHMRR